MYLIFEVDESIRQLSVAPRIADSLDIKGLLHRDILAPWERLQIVKGDLGHAWDRDIPPNCVVPSPFYSLWPNPRYRTCTAPNTSNAGTLIWCRLAPSKLAYASRATPQHTWTEPCCLRVRTCPICVTMSVFRSHLETMTKQGKWFQIVTSKGTASMKIERNQLSVIDDRSMSRLSRWRCKSGSFSLTISLRHSWSAWAPTRPESK